MAFSHRTQQARAAILRVVLAASGIPVADRTLRDLVRGHLLGEWTELDLGNVIRDLELDGYITGITREFDGQRIWSLTDKGQIQAAQIR